MNMSLTIHRKKISLAYFKRLEFWAVFFAFSFTDIFSILELISPNLSAFTNSRVLGFVRYGFLLLVLIRYIARGIDIELVQFTFFYLAILLLSGLLYARNMEYISEILNSYLLIMLPIIVVVLYVHDPKKLLDYLRVASYVVLIRMVLTALLDNILHHVDTDLSYMALGYGTVVNWSVILYFAFKEKKAIDWIIIVLTGICYFLFANRGMILCMAGLTIYFGLCSRTNRHRWRFIFTIGIIAFILYNSFFNLLIYLNSITNQLGIKQGRLLDTFGYDLLSTSGRGDIYARLIQAISENPIWGYGIGYDRIIGGGSGFYAHNLVLELMIDFGVIGGLIVIVYILVIFFKALVLCKDENYKALFAAFGLSGLIMLQLSGSVYLNYHIIVSLFIFFLSKKKRNMIVNEQ